MANDGLVVRTDIPGRVPQVEYTLAIPLGYEVLNLLQAVSEWGDKNCRQVPSDIDMQDRGGRRFASRFELKLTAENHAITPHDIHLR